MDFSFPKASIVIASYNNRKVLEKELDAMLRLDYPNEYEIIVVDDGSTDDTASEAVQAAHNDARLHIYQHPVRRLIESCEVCAVGY